MDRNSKRTVICILMTVVMCILTFLFYKDELSNLYSNVRYGRGTTEYYLLSASDDKMIWALGRDDSGDYVLAEGKNGKAGWINEIRTDALPERFLIDGLFAISDRDALLKVCKLDEAGMQEAWQIYQIADKGKKLIPLLSISCTGTTPEERRNSVVLGSFSMQQDKVSFLVWKNGTAYSYELVPESGDLRMVLSFQCDSFRDAFILSDGRFAVLNKKGGVSLYSSIGVPQYEVKTTTTISEIYPAKNGFYYLDRSNETLNQVVEKDGEFYFVSEKPVGNDTVLAIQEDGTLYYLENGRLYEDTGARTEISCILYGPIWMAWVHLALWFLACMVAGYLISMLLLGKRSVSILVKAGMFVIIAVLLLMGTCKAFVFPMQDEAVLKVAQQNLEITTGMGLRMTTGAGDGSVYNEPTRHTWQALSDAGFYESSITLYQYDDDGFLVLDTTEDSLEPGNVVTGNSMLLSAPVSGTVSEIKSTLNGPVCSCVSSDGKLLFEVNANLAGISMRETENTKRLAKLVLVTSALLLIFVFCIVLSVWFSIRNIMQGVYSITEGNYDIVISNPSADELESLAVSINNLTLLLKKNQEEILTMENRYRRFMPNSLFSLLDYTTIESITLDSCASYEFLLLSLEISKKDTLNNPLNTEQTLKEIDTLLSEMIRITREYNARIVSFTGELSVFAIEKDKLNSALELSVAYMEALDTVNAVRAEIGIDPIEIKEVLDFGRMDIGIVGVPDQMYAVALSDRKLHADLLVSLEHSMDISMVVTEAALGGVKPDDCRYLGTYSFKDGTERIYEVFSGDEFLLARRKRETLEEFNRGIDAFYRRDFREAKRIFLDLVRSGSSKDGAARYYLNFSDCYEKYPPEQIGLQIRLSDVMIEVKRKDQYEQGM